MYQRSVWLGPAGTRTPLHRDPYHNLLCQAWGGKAVRLHAPEHAAALAPYTQHALRNTSQVHRKGLLRYPGPATDGVKKLLCGVEGHTSHGLRARSARRTPALSPAARAAQHRCAAEGLLQALGPRDSAHVGSYAWRGTPVSCALHAPEYPAAPAVHLQGQLFSLHYCGF